MQNKANHSIQLEFDHLSIDVANNADAIEGLVQGLGLTVGKRPPFPFPGAWFYQDDHPLLHVIDRSHEQPETQFLQFNHIAFRANATLKQILDAIKHTSIRHWAARLPEENIVQLFLQISDSLVIELDMPTSADDPVIDSYRSTTFNLDKKKLQ